MTEPTPEELRKLRTELEVIESRHEVSAPASGSGMTPSELALSYNLARSDRGKLLAHIRTLTAQPLFKLGDLTLHSGSKSSWKIDCDTLTDADWVCLAKVAAERLPRFRRVVGVPNGGLRFAKALEQYITDGVTLELIADDVLTTGASMEKERNEHPWYIGVVAFARGPCPAWVTPLFSVAAQPPQQVPWALPTKEEIAQGLYEADHAGMQNVWLWDDSGLDDEHPGARDRYYRQADAILSLLREKQGLAVPETSSPENAACEQAHRYPYAVHSKPCSWPACELTCKGREHRLSARAAKRAWINDQFATPAQPLPSPPAGLGETEGE